MTINKQSEQTEQQDQQLEQICAQFAALLDQKHGAHIGEQFFSMTCELDPKIFYVKTVLQNNDQSFFYPIEAQVNREDCGELKAADILYVLGDFIDGYLEEYFSSGRDVFLPIDWASYDFDGINLRIKGQIFNLKAEKLADDILK